MAVSGSFLMSSVFPKTSVPVSLSSQNSVFLTNGGIKEFQKKNCLMVSRSRSRNHQRGLKVRCLFGLGVPELVVIVGVTALVFGPKKLPEIGRSIGKSVKSFQQAAKEFETELKREPEDAAEPTTANVEDLEISKSKESS